ncbi:MAG: hypothetical protein QHH24_04560 [Candidatus Bathyarchaeota archaeon]|jgi:hypothetical protein|nr:hypothetical protein [Candidatus Bathyarchaeota archaeon]
MAEHRLRLPADNKPAHSAEKTPAARLNWEKAKFTDKAAIPPISVISAPKEGPKRMPMITAITVAPVIVLPTAPMIGKAGRKEHMTYKAAKQAAKATFLVLDTSFIDTLAVTRAFGKSITTCFL